MSQVTNRSKNPQFFAILLGLALLLLIPLQAKATRNEVPETAVDQNSPINILHSDESGITFKLSPPDFVRTGVETDKGIYEQIRIPGYDYTGLVGQPDLPQKGFLIALPPGAEPVLNLVSAETNLIAGVNVAPTVQNTWLNVDEDPTAVDFVPDFETSYPFDESVYNQDANFPASPVSLGQQTTMRHQRVVWVIVNPVQVNPVQNTLTVYSQLEIEVTFEFPNGRPTTETLEPETGAFANTLRSNLLNYEQSLNWRTPDESKESAVMPETSPCLDANAFRIAVKQTGMHAITYANLAAAQTGFPTSVPNAKIRMCYEDQQIRIKINDVDTDGNFESGDSVVFYGESIKTQETETNIYWLTYSTAGANGLQMTTANDSAAGTAPAYYIPTYHLETDAKYLSLIPTDDLNDHWYWRDVLEAAEGVDRMDVEFQMSNKASGVYTFKVRVEFWAFTPDEDHEVEVELNGTSIGTGIFSGSGIQNVYYTFEADAPSALLQNGTNVLTIIAVDTDADPDNTGHKVLVNWVEVEPHRQFVAESNRLGFTQDTAGTYSFSVGSVPSGAAINIFNVTDPINPVVQTKTAAGGSVSFNRTIAGPSSYEVYASTAYLSPDSITKDSMGSGVLANSSNTADFIIITVPSLDSALTPLRTRRTSQGLIVKTVYVQDIFDEFSYGRYGYGIKDFLNYAYDNWNGDLDYVLLAGDGSYDHRDVLGNNGNSNLVPVYLRSGIDTRLGEAAADNQYVDFNGDNLAEMMLGRLPAQTPAELTNMIEKIIEYETGEANPSWRGRQLVVADNAYVPPTCEEDEAGDFFATANYFIANYFPQHILDRLYYAPAACFPDNSGPYDVLLPHYATTLTDMRNRLISKYNIGNQFVVYFGHGSTQSWGHESFISNTTVASLNNANRTPIMMAMTCLEGWYHFSGTSSGFSESLLKRVGGGAVASYAPTGFQVQTGHDFLIDGFYNEIFVNDAQTIGQAVMAAKMNLMSAAPSYQDLHDTFMLQGDPTMQFNMPKSVTQNFLPIGRK